MNYRHGFHAGNFADVHKHVALTLILDQLRQKATPFRVVDTHAGSGLYDLAGSEAARTGEWRDGIGRLTGFVAVQPASADTTAARTLLAPYLGAVATVNQTGGIRRYPGSPLITQHLLRPHDRLIACELQPDAARALARSLGRDARAKSVAIDGWQALTAYVPPKERRGIVLIDPPYEDPDEFERLAAMTAQAWRKWQTGIFLIWHPIKPGSEPMRLARALEKSITTSILRSDLHIGAPPAQTTPAGRKPPLGGSGLIVVNPPWHLAEQLRVIGAFLAIALHRESPCHTTTDWIRAPA